MLVEQDFSARAEKLLVEHQMTEPASLLPDARYQCQKLILVGDPKQLDPTIEGADSVHANGLEQTLFDRLILMGHIPTLLRTQYRCHPHISAIANSLFYGDMLTDGVTETDRQPLLLFLPTLCYYDVSRGTETSEGVGSFYNEAEAGFVFFLLQTFVLCGLGTERLGVITLYRAQVTRINDLLSRGVIEAKSEGRKILLTDFDYAMTNLKTDMKKTPSLTY
ncbi:hypothetical protein DPMN_006815 [Dreissena polymorpha]|uniref:DNA2/NAM7 helicase-like C-terminal domain-containing protein n=1 Tax=Dreissena polymorpha TaxID=45954 RepID=A0A9D4RVQ7_DREPO|nr:hypothetical protein DPMN_006815 [Dreissena polymorpha]